MPWHFAHRVENPRVADLPRGNLAAHHLGSLGHPARFAVGVLRSFGFGFSCFTRGQHRDSHSTHRKQLDESMDSRAHSRPLQIATSMLTSPRLRSGLHVYLSGLRAGAPWRVRRARRCWEFSPYPRSRRTPDSVPSCGIAGHRACEIAWRAPKLNRRARLPRPRARSHPSDRTRARHLGSSRGRSSSA